MAARGAHGARCARHARHARHARRAGRGGCEGSEMTVCGIIILVVRYSVSRLSSLAHPHTRRLDSRAASSGAWRAPASGCCGRWLARKEQHAAIEPDPRHLARSRPLQRPEGGRRTVVLTFETSPARCVRRRRFWGRETAGNVTGFDPAIFG